MSAVATTADRFIDATESLPPAPRILLELLTLIGDNEADSTRVAELIALDPALTARVLRLCNSVFFRGAEPVRDLDSAVLRLGFNEVYQIVAWAINERLMSGAQSGYGFGQGDLWRHTAVAALAGKILARRAEANPNLLFTATLLHDIGKLALNAALEEDYAEVARQTEVEGRSFLEAEQAILGVNHAQVGGRLLERWEFPADLVEAVQHHHDPLQAGPHQVLAAGVHLGDMLAHLLGYSYGHHSMAVRAQSDALRLWELNALDVEQLLLETQAVTDEIELLKPA